MDFNKIYGQNPPPPNDARASVKNGKNHRRRSKNSQVYKNRSKELQPFLLEDL